MKNISLVKVGGVCAILVAVSLIAMSVSGAWIESFEDAEQSLLAKADNPMPYVTQRWFYFLSFVLAMPAALGFYQILREAGALLWIAVVAVVAGGFIAMVDSLIILGVWYQLAPDYAEASAATRPALLVMDRTLMQIAGLGHLVEWALAAGIGVGLFAVAILQTAVLPKWIGWLGLTVVALVGGWLHLLTPVSDALGVIHDIKLSSFTLWMLVMGVALLRLREPVKTATGV